VQEDLGFYSTDGGVVWSMVEYGDVWWSCLQCFNAVGWVAGRASGL